jgi:hypothetical protein
MNVKHFATGMIFGIAGAAVALAFSAYRTSEDKEKGVDVSGNKVQYRWYSPQLPKSLSFANEPVPLSQAETQERIDREILVNAYWQSSTMYILKLAPRYFPTIEKVLRENGVPDDFKYLCVAESSLQNLRSSAGAIGYWQFMKETGKQFGLEISDEVDERYDIVKSTEAACRYLKSAYAKFGTWTAAAASYNCGMGGYSSYSTYQQTNNYYDLLLPDETMRYVFRILALKQIMKNAEQYGFFLYKGETYDPYKTRTVTVDTTINNLTDFAYANGTNYKTLKVINPWLRDKRLTVKPGKTYTVQVPDR